MVSGFTRIFPLILFASTHLVAGAELIVNGGFELPKLPSGVEYISHSAPTTAGNWVVSAGSVDWLPSSFIGSAEGSQALDLNGTSAGEIYQEVTTVPGENYRLMFYFSGNPCSFCGELTKKMEIRWGSTVVDTLEQDVRGRTASEPGWRRVTYEVIGTGSDRLSFRSLNGGTAGPLLDSISLVTAETPVTFTGLEIQKAVLLSFPTTAGRTYHVEWATKAESNSWTLLRSYLGTGGRLSVTDPAYDPMKVYRVVEGD